MSTPKPIEYSEDIRSQDTEKALHTVTVQLFPDEAKPWAVDFRGTCPRCGDAIEIRQWLVAVSGLLKLNDKQMEALAAREREVAVARQAHALAAALDLIVERLVERIGIQADF